MEQEFYVILFRAGSSGRFIGNLVWGSIYPNKYSFTISNYNSTHNQTPWASTYKFTVEHSMHLWRDKNLFEKIKLLSNPAMITAHSNFNFESFFSKFPYGKLIIITLTEDDKFEVNSNSLLKNGFENFKSPRMDYPDKIFIINRYKQKFKTEPTDGNFPDEFKKELLVPYFNSYSWTSSDRYFINLSVPDEYQSKILLLPYSQILNDKQKTLENISSFIKRNIPKNISDFYDRYIEGRKQLVEKYMI